MSRRRFFNAEHTYNTFIHSIEDHKLPTNLANTANTAAAITGTAGSNEGLYSNIVDPTTTAAAGGYWSNRPTIPISNDSNTIVNIVEPSPRSRSARTPLLQSQQQQHYQSELQSKRDNIDIWLTKRNLDETVKTKTLLINLNALFGIILLIIILQLCWTGTECIDNNYTEILKLICSISSIILVWQLLDRKKLQLSIKFREKRRKIKNLKAPIVKVTYWGLLSWKSNQFRYKLWIQILICIWHPIPYLNIYTGGSFPDSVGLLMFLRLHLLFRLIRDYSDIWLNRRSIKKISAWARAPDFDWWLAIKTVCYRTPIQFTLSVYTASVLLVGYCTYIFEREAAPDQFTFPISLFLGFQCVTLLWAADVYDVYNPVTWPGKFVCMFGAINGLLLTSFVIGIISQSIAPTKFEQSALNWITVEHIRIEERDLAARLIQFVWRNYCAEKELRDKLEKRNPRLYDSISEQNEKEFMEEFLIRCKALRNCRRERVELEEQLDPTSETNISPVDQILDNKLESVRAELLSMDIKHEDSLNRLEEMIRIVMNNQINSSKKYTNRSYNTTLSAPAIEPTALAAAAVTGGIKRRDRKHRTVSQQQQYYQQQPQSIINNELLQQQQQQQQSTATTIPAATVTVPGPVLVEELSSDNQSTTAGIGAGSEQQQQQGIYTTLKDINRWRNEDEDKKHESPVLTPTAAITTPAAGSGATIVEIGEPGASTSSPSPIHSNLLLQHTVSAPAATTTNTTAHISPHLVPTESIQSQQSPGDNINSATETELEIDPDLTAIAELGDLSAEDLLIYRNELSRLRQRDYDRDRNYEIQLAAFRQRERERERDRELELLEKALRSPLIGTINEPITTPTTTAAGSTAAIPIQSLSLPPTSTAATGITSSPARYRQLEQHQLAERERLSAGITLRTALRKADREREGRLRVRVTAAIEAARAAGINPGPKEIAEYLAAAAVADEADIESNSLSIAEEYQLNELRRKYFTKPKSASAISQRSNNSYSGSIGSVGRLRRSSGSTTNPNAISYGSFNNPSTSRVSMRPDRYQQQSGTAGGQYYSNSHSSSSNSNYYPYTYSDRYQSLYSTHTGNSNNYRRSKAPSKLQRDQSL